MNPDLLSFEAFGSTLRISAYLVLLLGGGLAGLWIALRRLRESGLICGRSAGILVLGGVLGIAGARAAAALGGEPAGFSLYGGALTFVFALAALCRYARLPVREMLDAILPCVLLGLAFCRLGCLLAGCCFGVPGEAGWSYPAGSPAHAAHAAAGLIDAGAPESHPTLPLPLMESVLLFLASAAASLLWRRGARPGRPAAACGLLYGAWRLLAETLRGDRGASLDGALTSSQVISLVVLAGSTIVFLASRRSTRAALDADARTPLIRTLAPGAFLGVALLAGLGSVACHRGLGNGFAHALGHSLSGAQCSGNACSGLSVPSRKQQRSKVCMTTKVGEGLTIHVRAEGTFEIADVPLSGPVRVRGTLETMVVEAGDLRVEGRGDVDLSLHPDGAIVIERATVGEDLLSALTAVGPFTAGALTVKDGPPARKDLEAALRKALEGGATRAVSTGTVTLAGFERTFRGEGRLTPSASGASRLAGTITIDLAGEGLVFGAEYREDPGGRTSEAYVRLEPQSRPGAAGLGR